LAIPSAQLSIQEQREEVQRVLHAPQFRRSPKLQRFLELICDYHFQGRPSEITEYMIATEAFGKGESFDSSHDSLVRVQAREARRRLREYYQSEGSGSVLVLDIPLGSYAPVFSPNGHGAGTDNTRPSLPVWQRVFWSSAAVLAITLAVSAALLVTAYRERRQLINSSALASGSMGVQRPRVAKLWNRFLDSDVPTVVVLSNPPVWDDPVCQAAGTATPSPEASAPGPCPDEYTGMGEAVALHVITNLFKTAKQTLILKQSRMVTADDIKRYNLILLGGHKVNVWTGKLGKDVNMRMTPEERAAVDADSSRKFATVFDQDSGQLIRDRAAIALHRQAQTGHWSLFLYGQHTQGTQAAAEAATDEAFLSQLKWPPASAPFPDSFRILIGVSVNDGIPESPVPALVNVP
jgi:hypothetical protein